MKENERTFQMKLNFMKHHRDGMTIPEIADHYNLSRRTVYRSLQSIADTNGVSRDALLKVPHAEHAKYEREFILVKPINVSDFRQKMEVMVEQMKATLASVDQAIEEQMTVQEILEEEMNA